MGQPIYILKQMPNAEFVDWIAYSRIEPFGERRADWRAAQLSVVTIEAARGIMQMLAGKKAPRASSNMRTPKPLKMADFLLKFEKPKPRQTWQNQLQMVEMLNSMFGGKDERKR